MHIHSVMRKVIKRLWKLYLRFKTDKMNTDVARLIYNYVTANTGLFCLIFGMILSNVNGQIACGWKGSTTAVN